MNTKECKHCKQLLPLESFAVVNKVKDRRAAICRRCFRYKYYNKDSDWNKAYRRNYTNMGTVLLKFLLSTTKSRAKRNSLPFDLTVDDIVIPKHCPITGLLLAPGSGKANNNSPTIDKVIPSLGYTKQNTRVISYLANACKRDVTDPIVFDNIAAYLRGTVDPVEYNRNTEALAALSFGG